MTSQHRDIAASAPRFRYLGTFLRNMQRCHPGTRSGRTEIWVIREKMVACPVCPEDDFLPARRRTVPSPAFELGRIERGDGEYVEPSARAALKNGLGMCGRRASPLWNEPGRGPLMGGEIPGRQEKRI